MKYEKGMTVWLIPTRYWEETEPEPWVVVKDSDDGWLLAKPEFDTQGYIQKQNVYAYKSNAIIAIHLLTALYENRSNDDGRWLTAVILSKPPKAKRKVK
jgi:hypothetical protein